MIGSFGSACFLAYEPVSIPLAFVTVGLLFGLIAGPSLSGKDKRDTTEDFLLFTLLTRFLYLDMHLDRIEKKATKQTQALLEDLQVIYEAYEKDKL
jgi:hypothetical protein